MRRIKIRLAAALTAAGLLLLPAAALAEPPTQGAPAMILILLGAARKASGLRGDQPLQLQSPKTSAERRPAHSALARVAPDAEKPAATGSPQTGR